MAREILAGKKAGDIPLKLARTGTIIVNAITMERLGLEVDYDVFDSADLVIEHR